MIRTQWKKWSEEGALGLCEGKLHGSKQPGVKTPLQVLPTILCKTKNSLTEEKKKDIKVDYTQLPARPASGQSPEFLAPAV